MASKKPTRQALDRQAKARIGEQEAKVALFIERIRAFLEKNLTPILEGLQSGTATAKEAAKALGGLESAIEDAGFAEKLDSIKSLFAAEYDAVTQEFKDTTGKAAILGDFARKNIDAMIDERLFMASTYVTDYIGDVRGVIMDSVIAGKAFKVKDVLNVAEGRHFAYMETEVATTLMAYQRIVHMEKAKKAGINKFIYVGPDDKITRPFCKEHVDNIYTEEQIAEMDNEQNLPVSVYCGGYNCRHHWRPISDELAAEIEAENDQNA
jgi:hypothetical protein